MRRSAFELLRQMEHSWWYRARTRMLKQVLGRVNARPMRILDFGAGWGGMHDALSEGGALVYAYEPDAQARAACAERGYADVFATEAEAFAEQYDCISLLDVLEHIENDRGFLERAKQALAPGGILLISVPAFPFLWSMHDVEHQHFRRYTRPSLSERLTEAGYTTLFASYWNASLFFPAAAMRLLGRTGESALALPSFMDALLYALLQFESWALSITSLPFGTGLVAAGKRANDASGRAQVAPAFFMRYLVVGVLGALVQTGTLFVWVSLLGLTREYLLGVVMGFLLALAVTFLLQKYWTFRESTSSRLPLQFVRYTAVALSGLALNSALLALAKALLDALHIDFFNGWYLLAQVIILILVSLFNFLLNSYITFAKHSRFSI